MYVNGGLLTRRSSSPTSHTEARLRRRNAHPLDSTSGESSSDVSRPTLRRLTSETERQAAAADGSSRGGSERGSLDLLRMTPGSENGEVEVLVHQVKPGESLAGIALLYGIELATLRKTNKLWPSDPVHLRTHLYVPLDACRWNKASESFKRGPGEGQITLTSRHHAEPNGLSEKKAGKQVDRSNRVSGERMTDGSEGELNEHEEWGEEGEAARTFMPSTNAVYDHLNRSPILGAEASPSNPTLTPTMRIMDIVRLPSSQLRFFPRGKPPEGDSPSRSRPVS
ncbi:hypothetical protein P7C73_g3625, partial [Tremellales sp. Uapishka_1]